jgi:hypothetical protein
MKMLDLISEGFTRFLLAAFQVPRVTRMHVGALEVTGEDISKILPAIDVVSWQMIWPGPSGIGQVDREELDDEEVIVWTTRSAREAVVLQLDTRVSFAIVHDDVA